MVLSPRLRLRFFKEKYTLGSGTDQPGHKPDPKGKAHVSRVWPSFSSSPSLKVATHSWVRLDVGQPSDLGASSSVGKSPAVMRMMVSTGSFLVSVPVGLLVCPLSMGLPASLQWLLLRLIGSS